MFRPLNKVKPYSVGFVLGWVTKCEYPMLSFFFFFSPPLFKAILKTAELPSLCNVVSSIYQLFFAHFAMAVFMCTSLYYRINKRHTSFELSSILSTVDRSKHLITACSIRKFIQLVNFETFSVFFLFFSNQVWLNPYERAPSGNELHFFFFFLKNIFYENIEGEICEILRIF